MIETSAHTCEVSKLCCLHWGSGVQKDPLHMSDPGEEARWCWLLGVLTLVTGTYSGSSIRDRSPPELLWQVLCHSWKACAVLWRHPLRCRVAEAHQRGEAA